MKAAVVTKKGGRANEESKETRVKKEKKVPEFTTESESETDSEFERELEQKLDAAARAQVDK